MIAVAERINGMFKDVRKAIQKKDRGPVVDLAQQQTEAGAKYLDINVGTAAADQLAAMRWLVETVQGACDTPIALDSQKLDVIKAGLDVYDGKRGVMINSVSGDPDKLDVYMPLAVEHGAALVTLTINVDGVPQNVDTRIEIAATIFERAIMHGMDLPKVFIDPIVLPVTVDQKQPKFICDVISQIKMLSDPAPNTIVGLSNMSQGTSNRPLINRIALVMLQAYGLDAAIVDVLDTELMDAAITTDMLLNRMIYSDSYLRAARM